MGSGERPRGAVRGAICAAYSRSSQRRRPKVALLRRELRPAAGGHVAQDVAHPGEFLVLREMLRRLVTDAAGVAQGAWNVIFSAPAASVTLFCTAPAGAYGGLPGAHTARRELRCGRTACARWPPSLPSNVSKWSARNLCAGGDVDLALVLLHQLQPAGVPRILALALVLEVEIGLFLARASGSAGKFEPDEVAVLRALQRDVLRARVPGWRPRWSCGRPPASCWRSRRCCLPS